MRQLVWISGTLAVAMALYYFQTARQFAVNESPETQNPTGTEAPAVSPAPAATPNIAVRPQDMADANDPLVSGNVGKCLRHEDSGTVLRINRNQDDVYELYVLEVGSDPQYRKGQVLNVGVAATESDPSLRQVPCPE